MNAKELRIGNFTRDKINKTSYEINVNSLLYLIEFEELEKEISIEPIPLTEEWLLKFGFKIFNHISWSIDDVIIFSSNSPAGKSNKIQQPFYFVASRILVGITHVHQLQNLYFALTGEELELKTDNL